MLCCPNDKELRFLIKFRKQFLGIIPPLSLQTAQFDITKSLYLIIPCKIVPVWKY